VDGGDREGPGNRVMSGFGAEGVPPATSSRAENAAAEGTSGSGRTAGGPASAPKPDQRGGEDPLWYKDAILYEVHVRAFADSDGDGMGDFKGLTAKLDYLRDLGVTAIWLLPFYPSPWRDDGYDISDYDDVHPAYGTLDDFRAFLAAAHQRGLKVITELVVNHTSDRHPWFERARRAAAGTPERDFYVWSDNPEKYADARIIFTDTESSNWAWDPVAKAYYWHRFFSHQPDLNFDNPRVHEALLAALDFWMELGVDGLRLDAVPYLYEREGTNCENLPETHQFLKQLRAHVDARFTGRMLLAEANQWPEDSIAYFGDPARGGDECHMAFNFPVMPRLYMAIRLEDRFPVVDILEQTPPIPEKCQWATFLRNHDELTLEMVTDEDRDYMYRVYAQDVQARINVGIRRRLAPLMGKERRRIELMNGLLFSLPGAPVLYYGDEIGMGDNIYIGDRNGVRTPMQWNGDRNAGFSTANPQRLYLPVITDPDFHYQAINVETQQSNPHSLLWWTRRLIALRKRYQAFSRGTLEFLHPGNHRVLAFVRRHEGETLLVAANLSRFAQPFELDLSAFAGLTPVELFGRSNFPVIAADRAYPLTLSHHSFYWFSLEPRPVRRSSRPAQPDAREAAPPVVVISGGWESCWQGMARSGLEAALAVRLPAFRWFAGKARAVRAAAVKGAVPLPPDACLLLVEISYTDGEPETYAVPLAFVPLAAGEEDAAGLAARLLRDDSWALIARLRSDSAAGTGLLYDPMIDEGFARGLLAAIAGERRIPGAVGGRNGEGDGIEVAGWAEPDFATLRGEEDPEPRPARAEQSNSSLRYGDRFMLKLFRKLEPGVNPDLEVGRYLTERTTFRGSPRVAGGLDLRRGRESMTLAMLQGWVEGEADAWTYTLDALGRYFERVRTGWGRGERGPAEVPDADLLALADRAGVDPPPAELVERLGSYLPMVRQLGERTAELHLALAAAPPEETAFAPEPMSTLHQRSLYQSMRALAGRTFQLLAGQLGELPPAARPDAEALLAAREQVMSRFRRLLDGKISATRIRCHGDYHLGQVLFTGKDFVILDFEGEPARPLTERRLKRSPFRDVAGMLRSFQYAAHARLLEEAAMGTVEPRAMPELESWAFYWERWASAAFLRAYLERAGGASFVPRARAQLGLLIEVFVLEKAIYELGYELNNRPAWVRIPLAGIRQILSPAAETPA
jgi:maltose alpha-D-glucosyltransferase/alpha-amylase